MVNKKKKKPEIFEYLFIIKIHPIIEEAMQKIYIAA